MEIDSYKMDVAGAVLALAKARLAMVDAEGVVSVGAYQNGREQGYSLSLAGVRFVCFSEARGSDSIVVYFGESDPMQSITEEMYKGKSKMFHPRHTTEAAEYVVSRLTEALKK
ncbi:MAG: hypothetical protein WC683_04070 [bacterium]